MRGVAGLAQAQGAEDGRVLAGLRRRGGGEGERKRRRGGGGEKWRLVRTIEKKGLGWGGGSCSIEETETGLSGSRCKYRCRNKYLKQIFHFGIINTGGMGQGSTRDLSFSSTPAT